MLIITSINFLSTEKWYLKLTDQAPVHLKTKAEYKEHMISYVQKKPITIVSESVLQPNMQELSEYHYIVIVEREMSVQLQTLASKLRLKYPKILYMSDKPLYPPKNVHSFLKEGSSLRLVESNT